MDEDARRDDRLAALELEKLVIDLANADLVVGQATVAQEHLEAALLAVAKRIADRETEG